jgi:hypothetical protein
MQEVEWAITTMDGDKGQGPNCSSGKYRPWQWHNSQHNWPWRSDYKIAMDVQMVFILDEVESKRMWYIFLNILPILSQYILSLLLFVVKNMEEFISNSEVHSINTRHKFDLYPPATIKKELTTQGLKFLITYLKIPRTYLAMLKNFS